MTAIGRRPHFEFAHVGSLEAPAGFEDLVSASVDVNGPVALWAQTGTGDRFVETRPGRCGSVIPTTRHDDDVSVTLVSYDSATLRATQWARVAGMVLTFPLVQSLTDGRFVVTGARCEWSPEGPEENAMIIGANGTIERRGTLGDGLNHLLCDEADQLWCGYFDEGVYGNYGWGHPQGPLPLGAAGIVQWSTSFEKLWQCADDGEYLIDDCYSLNVDQARVWSCPYAYFPLLEISEGRVTSRPTAFAGGSRGVLVAGDTVALIGSYEAPDSLLLGTRTDTTHLESGSLRVPHDDGTPAERLVCRGSMATLFAGADVFRFDLAESLG